MDNFRDQHPDLVPTRFDLKTNSGCYLKAKYVKALSLLGMKVLVNQWKQNSKEFKEKKEAAYVKHKAFGIVYSVTNEYDNRACVDSLFLREPNMSIEYSKLVILFNASLIVTTLDQEKEMFVSADDLARLSFEGAFVLLDSLIEEEKGQTDGKMD